MNPELLVMGGQRVLVCPAQGSVLCGEADALDLIGLAMAQGAGWVAAPVERLGNDFFRLESRVAGEMIQKFVNYRVRLAIVGDLSAPLARSGALRDFVHESNKGRHVWFVEDMQALAARLAEASDGD